MAKTNFLADSFGNRDGDLTVGIGATLSVCHSSGRRIGGRVRSASPDANVFWNPLQSQNLQALAADPSSFVAC